MPDTPPDALTSAIRDGRALIVCGAGVSLSVTDGKAPGWKTLIERGRDAAKARGAPNAPWIGACKSFLEADDATQWLRAADIVKQELGPDGFADFLHRDLGSLAAIKPVLLDAIARCAEAGNRVATTNYDHLISQHLRWARVDWLEPAYRAVQALRDGQQAVWHIHGDFKRPESVVFSADDYKRVKADDHAQFVQKLAALHLTFVFVGCSGSGLGDENVGRLLDWLREGFSALGDKHFVLTTDDNKDAWPAGVEVVRYGRRADLSAFLEKLAPPRAKTDFPLPPPHFTGRDEDEREVREAILSPSPTALVLGPPGVGKTALTKAVANHLEVAARYPVRWFVELETATSDELLQAEVSKAVGADPKLGFDGILARLATSRGLILLDNLETPWDGKGERDKVETTLARLSRTPGVALLASFRGDIAVGGAAWAIRHKVKELGSDEAKRLFCAWAGENLADDPHLPKFLAELGGLPLAVVLVAKRAFGAGTLADLWRQWQARGAELARDPDRDPGRLTSLDRSIDFSLSSTRLTPQGRRLFALLGRLPAGLCGEDRDALLGAEGYEAAETLRRLGLAFSRDGRIDLLPPIRDYSRRNVAPEGADAAVWPTYFLSLAKEKAGGRIREGAMQRLLPEFANIAAALTDSLSAWRAGNEDRRLEAVRAAWGYGRIAWFTGHPAPILADLTIACREAGDALGEANCIMGLGDIAFMRSAHVVASKAYEEALSLYRKVGDALGEANCIKGLGDIALRRSDHEAAREAYKEARPLYRKVGNTLGEANCIYRLGEIALARADHATARKSYEEALLLYRKVGATIGAASCIFSLGGIALRHSDHATARELYEEALLLYRKVGDTLGEANCIISIGDIALARSDYTTARRAYEEAVRLYRKVGDALGEANCIRSLGDIAFQRSDYTTAHGAYEEALRLYRKVGDVLGEANCVRSLGGIAIERSDHTSARGAYEEALPLYRKVGDAQGEGNCFQGLGDIAQRDGDAGKARGLWRQALAQYERTPEPYSIGHAHRRLAHLAEADAERTEHVEAARAAWESIEREDLVEKYLRRLGG